MGFESDIALVRQIREFRARKQRKRMRLAVQALESLAKTRQAHNEETERLHQAYQKDRDRLVKKLSRDRVDLSDLISLQQTEQVFTKRKTLAIDRCQEIEQQWIDEESQVNLVQKDLTEAEKSLIKIEEVMKWKNDING